MHIWFGWVPCTCTDAYGGVGSLWGHLRVSNDSCKLVSGSLPRSEMLEMFIMIPVVTNVASTLTVIL